MTSRQRHRSALRQSLYGALGVIALASTVIAYGQISYFLVEQAGPVMLYVCITATALVYLGTGLVAWARRPGNRCGLIMVLTGLSWFLSAAGNLTSTPVAAIGTAAATSPLVFIVWLLHVFPSGRIRSRLSQVTVIGGFIVALVLQAPLYLFEVDGPYPVSLAVADRPDLVALGGTVQSLAGMLVMLSTAWVLLARIRRAPAQQRVVLATLYAYGIVAVLSVPLGANVLAPLLALSAEGLVAFQLSLLAGLPIVFLWAMLQGVFARTGEVTELGEWIGDTADDPADDTAVAPVLAALRRALGDPSVELGRWSGSAYLDAAGNPIRPPRPDADRASVEIGLGSRRVGVITYDADLNPDPEPVRAAGAIAAVALENARLTAELRANQSALQLSRERLVEAGDRARRRLAQNLHDGLQVELVLLALQAQELAELEQRPADLPEAAERLRERIDGAARELRELVHDVMPAPLMERGLIPAVVDLADRMPLPTSVAVSDRTMTLPPTVESTAYFVIAEALSNAVKHAQATRLDVRVDREGNRLIIVVIDDGVGGAVAGTGAGLSGIANRVDVLGGRLTVESPPGAGTRLRVELPCGS